MHLLEQCHQAGNVRRGHGCSGERQRLITAGVVVGIGAGRRIDARLRGNDIDRWRRDVGLQARGYGIVGPARRRRIDQVAGAEGGLQQGPGYTAGQLRLDEVAIGQGDHRRRDGNGGVGTAHDKSVTRRAIDDDDRRRSRGLRIGNLDHKGAAAAIDDHGLAADSGGIGQGRTCSCRAGGIGQDQGVGRGTGRQRWAECRGSRGIGTGNGRGRGDLHFAGLLATIHRTGDGDRAQRDTRAAGDHEGVATVAGRCDDDDAARGGIVGGFGGDVVQPAVRRAEGHVDHIQAIAKVVVTVRVEGPVQGLGHEIRAADTAEDANRIEARLGRDARLDAQVGRQCGRVGAGVSRPGSRHAETGGGTGNVGAVAVAIHGVGVGGRNQLGARSRRVVAVAGQVDAADNLCGREVGRTTIRVCRGVQALIGRQRAVATEVRVHVVDAGVDDADADAGAIGLAAIGKAGPDLAGVHEGHALVAVQHLRRDQAHRHDARQRLQGSELVARHDHGHAIDRLAGAVDFLERDVLAAGGGDERRLLDAVGLHLLAAALRSLAGELRLSYAGLGGHYVRVRAYRRLARQFDEHMDVFVLPMGHDRGRLRRLATQLGDLRCSDRRRHDRDGCCCGEAV